MRGANRDPREGDGGAALSPLGWGGSGGADGPRPGVLGTQWKWRVLVWGGEEPVLRVWGSSEASGPVCWGLEGSERAESPRHEGLGGALKE